MAAKPVFLHRVSASSRGLDFRSLRQSYNSKWFAVLHTCRSPKILVGNTSLRKHTLLGVVAHACKLWHLRRLRQGHVRSITAWTAEKEWARAKSSPDWSNNSILLQSNTLFWKGTHSTSQNGAPWNPIPLMQKSGLWASFRPLCSLIIFKMQLHIKET